MKATDSGIKEASAAADAKGQMEHRFADWYEAHGRFLGIGRASCHIIYAAAIRPFKDAPSDNDAELDQIIRREDYRSAIALLREAHKRMGNTAFPALAHRIALFLSTAPSVLNGNDSSSASSSPKSAAVTPTKGIN